jgi:transposase
MARSSELTPAIRERICELHAIQWGYKRIQKRYPYIPLSTIRYTIKKEHERRDGVSKARSGRPKKLSEAEKDQILEAIHGNPRITQEDLLTSVDHKVKLRSIQRLLNAENLRKWRCSWRPYLTDENAAKRLRWAYRYRHFTPEDWARVFWSDECTVERGIGVRREWTFTRPRDQPKEGQVQGLPQRGKQVKQMFWAAFSGAVRRTGLIPLFGDPESERGGINRFVIEELYRRILPTLMANEDGIFQQDNAPTHTAHLVREALQEMNIEVMEWPPHSPDLNPIENLWALLKASIYKLRPDLIDMRNNNETKAILVETAQQAWDELDLHHFSHLSETMPHRVEAIIESQGWYTPY